MNNHPIHIALSREAAIAAEHLGAGATIVGKSNYAHHAHYGQAFFSISTGIERSAKLALAVHHALLNQGTFPEPRELRAYGHNLADLLSAMNVLAEDLALPPEERLPSSDVSSGIINVLSEFASNITRYYNLDLVMDNVHNRAGGDPIESWFRLVTEPILEAHLTEKRRNIIEQKARIISGLSESHSIISFTSETGQPLNTVYSASLQAGLTNFSNPYARMYVLQFTRFYAQIMSGLTTLSYQKRIECIPHLSEYFCMFNNEDSYFKSRKMWSIYEP